MLGLPADGALPDETEPGQVLIDRGLEFGTAACDIDILDAQEEPAAETLGEIGIEQGGIGMAQMKPPVRAGSESKNRLRHGSLQLKGMTTTWPPSSKRMRFSRGGSMR